MGLREFIFGSQPEKRSAPKGMDVLERIASSEGTSLSRASGLSVAYRAISARAEGVASLPLRIYKRTDGGGREEVTQHPLSNLLSEMPEAGVTAFEFREAMSADADIHGNSYARVVADGTGRVRQVCRMRPETVTIERIPGGKLRYRHTDDDGRLHVLLQGEVIHIRHRGRDGVYGVSPIAWAREAVEIASQQAAAANAMMKNGTRLSGIISFAETISADQADRLRYDLKDRFQGANNAGMMMVLDGGGDFKPMSMTARDAEFLESRKLSNLEIARLFGVPPTVVGITDNATYSNVTQENRAFVSRCLDPWTRRIEAAMSSALLTETERRTLFIEHDLSGLLRGDIEARFEAYRVGRDGGWLSANDVRKAENMGPIDGGDTYLQPLNMADAKKGGGKDG